MVVTLNQPGTFLNLNKQNHTRYNKFTIPEYSNITVSSTVYENISYLSTIHGSTS